MSTESASGHSRKHPFPGPLKVNRKLTLGGSEKDTRHFEIGLHGSGLHYEVGDSLGIFPQNDPALVSELLKTLGFSGEEEVLGNAGSPLSIRQALTTDFIITEPSKQLLLAISQKVHGADFLKNLLDPDSKADLEHYLWGREVIDPLLEFPGAKFEPEGFVSLLRKLQPRLYSIASSRKAVGEEVHLTIAIVRYESHGRPRKGVTSTYLAERVAENATVPVFVHTAKHFRVPEDPATPIIMVGPGTGIAPFRAFLQERQAAGATGKNWLFFGEQRAESDFLYREEFEAYQRDGILNRFDTAFSRDQAFKIYVQTRILEQAKELYAWFQEGAYFYVCGDAQRMAKDVDAALHKVFEQGGGQTPEQAAESIAELKKEKRYRKDVY